VPAEYRRHEYLGMQGKILPSRTTSIFKPNLPARSEKFQLRFMPVHPVDVLSSPRGMVQEIEAGTYGGGEWFVVESGKALLTRDGSRVVLQLGNRSFYMTMGSYHLLIGR
jgi:hypothetical protein